VHKDNEKNNGICEPGVPDSDAVQHCLLPLHRYPPCLLKFHIYQSDTRAIGRHQPIAVIPFCFWGLVNYLLNGCLSADPDHGPTQNATGFAIYHGENVDSVFLSPIKVNNSSISASFTSSGIGALGKASARSVTQ
jgi:hypothetical protein